MKDRINEDMKSAMRAKDKARLGVIRLILAEIKQKEVDERIVLTDDDIVNILNKMIKQRRESIKQYEAGNRPELAEKEQFEITVIDAYLPEGLSDAEVDALIQEAVQSTGASGPQDMGKVMGVLKQKAQGRVDMSQVSSKVKAALS